LAGSLNNCLIDDAIDNSRFIANLFMPPPSMALMIGNRSRNSDTWTYIDLLSDRLQVMMPLVPGFVMSLVHDGDISAKSLDVLNDMLAAVGGSFHRVFGVIMEGGKNSS
jgi:hypothetical protein